MSALSFEYRAMDRGGVTREGVTTALNKVDAYRQIAATGLTPLRIRESKHAGGSARRKIKAKDISQFTYQLSVLIGARIPIGEGLRSIVEQESNVALAKIVSEMAGRIEAGTPIAEALEPHRAIFGNVFVDTLHAAERSGNMIEVLEYLSEMLEDEDQRRSQLRTAMMYPLSVLGVLGLALIFLIGYVVPKFGAIYAARGVELPLLTKSLMVAGQTLQSYWYLFLVGAVGAFFGIRSWAGSERGRFAVDRVLHRVPYLRSILVGIAVSRFARVLGLSIRSGLGLIESLELSGRAAGRPMLTTDVDSLIEQVRRGGRLSEVLTTCSYLPSFAKRMLTAGEESAELVRMCSIVALHHERETNALVKNVSTVIEPVMIVLIALVVLLIALAIFVPMWNMVSLVG